MANAYDEFVAALTDAIDWSALDKLISYADYSDCPWMDEGDEKVRREAYVHGLWVNWDKIDDALKVDVCVECGRDATVGDGVYTHCFVGESVVIGCEGYWIIDPRETGLELGGWQAVEMM